MDSQVTMINYQDLSTGLATPVGEYESNLSFDSFDQISGSQYQDEKLKVSKTSTVIKKKQTLISDFFPQIKRVQSYVRTLALSEKQLSAVTDDDANDKIPYYFRLLSKNNQWRGLDYSMFEVIFQFISMEDCQFIFAKVCKQWRHLYLKMFCSYSSLKLIDNSVFCAKEMKIILDQGSNLAHIRMLKDIIKKDFKNQIKFFNQNIVLQARVADRLFDNQNNVSKTKGANSGRNSRLLKTFKIKTKAINSQHNFISDGSLHKLCYKSRSSLEEISIRNGTQLTNIAITKSISMLNSLQKLDLSYCRQIDDSVISSLSIELPQLKNIGLRFLNNITKDSLIKVLDNMRSLEGLDISGCFSIDLQCLTKLRGNRQLKCLLLEYLMVKSEHIKNLIDTNINTLSIFYSKTVNFTHVDVLIEAHRLVNLNLSDCPQLQVQDIERLIIKKEGQKIKTLKASQDLSGQTKERMMIGYLTTLRCRGTSFIFIFKMSLLRIVWLSQHKFFGLIFGKELFNYVGGGNSGITNIFCQDP
eukprot:403337486